VAIIKCSLMKGTQNRDMAYLRFNGDLNKRVAVKTTGGPGATLWLSAQKGTTETAQNQVNFSCEYKNQSRQRPKQTRAGSRFLGFQIPDIGTRWWQGCQPYTPATFTPSEIHLVLISVRVWVKPRAIVRPEGVCQWTFPMTPWRIKPATCRFVA
jgi:hypothetical protein